MSDLQASHATNLDRYGLPVLEWDRVRELLEKGPQQPQSPFFLGTTRPDGRPHSVGIGPVWIDGDLYFTSGLGTRKSRNLAENAACCISARLTGLDLVLEGEAEVVTDQATLDLAAVRFREAEWPATVQGEAFTAPFSAPSAGPPPWHLYRFTFHTAFVVAYEEPCGATRWRFTHEDTHEDTHEGTSG